MQDKNRVIDKINEAHNILIALSSDPSVDEMAAAIGLTLHLDRMGKRATAIYSGHTPNALEFLKPEETFERTADALQDFVIALSKEKADHLRYKLDGEYVKIFITPYRSRIDAEDLEFSYGDFNVDLVLALGVANGIDLDAALREHGRIMHDASIINITTGNPGKFGEIEWSDKSASSVSEMLADILYNMDSEVKITPEEATAFLTGIVAATDRFSKANTTANSMEISSRLMDSGANHQLVSKNITADLDNRLYNGRKPTSAPEPEQSKDDAIDISHRETTPAEDKPAEDKPAESKPAEPATKPAVEAPAPASEPADNALLEELKTAEANLASASDVTTPDVVPEPVDLTKPEKTITPPTDFVTGNLDEGTNKYGKMLEDILAEEEAKTTPVVQSPAAAAPAVQDAASPFEVNPAASIAPPVASTPEINGVPEINYMPLPGDQVLPPPPAPPISMDKPFPDTIEPAAPAPTPAPFGAAPTLPPAAPSEPGLSPTAPTIPSSEPVLPPSNPAEDDLAPTAFRIPGM